MPAYRRLRMPRKRPQVLEVDLNRSESRWRRAACPSGGPSGSWGYLPLGGRLRPERQPRELFADHPQLVLRAGFAEPVDQPDQRADMLLGQFKELLGCLDRHRTSSGRTATVSHGSASLQMTLRQAPHGSFFFWA